MKEKKKISPKSSRVVFLCHDVVSMMYDIMNSLEI